MIKTRSFIFIICCKTTPFHSICENMYKTDYMKVDFELPNENMVKIYENVIKNNILNKQFKSIILLGVTKGVYAYII